MSLFLDRTGEPASQQQDSCIRLKNKDTSFIDQQLVLYLAHSGITAAAGKENRNDRIECTIPKIRNWIYLFNNDFYWKHKNFGIFNDFIYSIYLFCGDLQKQKFYQMPQKRKTSTLTAFQCYKKQKKQRKLHVKIINDFYSKSFCVMVKMAKNIDKGIVYV